MDYDYDEYEDLYADELELVDELHTEAHLPTKRVVSGRDDVTDSDTPRSASSAKRTSDQIGGSSPQATASPTLESVRKRLKLNDTSMEDTLPDPCSPRDLIIDEEEEQGAAGSLQGEEPLLLASQEAAEATPELFQTASWEDADVLSSYTLSVGLRDKGGRLKFVGLRNENWAEDVEELRGASRHRGNLLSKPFWDIWLEAQAELERKHAEPDKPDGVIKSHATELLPEGMNVGDVSGSPDHGTPPVPAALWVDTYRPRHFMELLSDDGVNRTLLQWLKLWDCVVFGRPRKTKLHQEKQQNTNNFVKKYLPELNEELDEHKRPQQKVVLLHGPPGLGKTTLAHVIATHAGYNVVELNASDDRSPEVFKTALEAATQMRAVMGQDPRPNCLVIDEIDGAPAASINVLVSMIKCTGKSAGGGKKSKKEGSLLMRPVICICNELYVPALRPLRQIAFTLHFPSTHKTRLATRLQEIMRRERMKGDTAAVLALCEKAGNDVRSCLSTLQFVQSRKRQLTLTDVRTFTVGQKDVQRGLLSILLEIFQKRRNTRKTHLYGSDSNADGNAEELRLESIVHSAQAFGDYEKLMQALFDNYVHVNFKDPRFETIQRAPEWLCFADELLHVVHRLQDYSLYPYLPYMAPAFHCFFSVVPYTKMVFQNSFLEAKAKEMQLSNILTALFAETAAQIRCHLTGNRVVLDVLPWLLCIIQPTIRPVNTQLFSAQEKQQFHQLISVMAAFNLTYQQARTADGVYQYALEPNIEEVTKFPGISSQQPLTYATKQLIARELELEKMRKSDVTDARDGQKSLQASAVSKSWAPPVKTTAKIAEEPVRVAVDFFGRVVQKPRQAATSGCSVGSATSSGIWYQFKEGFSNAVRRTIRIKDLL